MSIQAVDRATHPIVFNDKVFAVATMMRDRIAINDFACAYGFDLIQWYAVVVTFDRFDIDTLMKLGADDPIMSAFFIANKAVFTPGPWT